MNHQEENLEVSESKIFECFAAARRADTAVESAESFVDVEEYENSVMYPNFAHLAKKAGFPEISSLFLKVAGEEKVHAIWLREIYSQMGKPKNGTDTLRAKEAMKAIQQNCEKLIEKNPKSTIERCLKVAISVEEREYKEIYPKFRDQAKEEGNLKAAEVYQRVIDSEAQHAGWFNQALLSLTHSAQPASFGATR